MGPFANSRWRRTPNLTGFGITRREVIALTALGFATAPEFAFAAGPEGQLTWGIHVSLAPELVRPGRNSGGRHPFMELYALHDAMVKPMPGNPQAPSLAESWSAAEDALTYEFVLRQGARFHNGDLVTAEDVKFSFERYKRRLARLAERAGRRGRDPRSSARAFMLKKPWPDFLTFYASATGAGWIVPKKYVEKVGDDGFKKAPIGAGPYKFVSFTPGVELVFEAFDQYWRKTPSVKRLVFKSIPDETTRLAALKRGEVDIVYSIRGELAEELQRTPGLTLKPVVPQGHAMARVPRPVGPTNRRGTTSGCGGPPIWQSTARSINQAITLGYSKLTNSIIPYTFEFYWQPPEPVYDPEKAKQLLAEAGHPNGFDAGEYYCDASYANVAEAILDNFQAVGIRCKLRPLERAAFFEGHASKKFQGIIQAAAALSAMPRPASMHSSSRAAPTSTGSYPDIDALFQQQAAELDHQKRASDAAQDAAARSRAGDLCADLAAGVHQWRWASGRAVGFRLRSRASLYRALRGHHAQERIA